MFCRQHSDTFKANENAYFMKKLTFKQAFKYPFNRAKGLWNVLWALVPFVGWLALWGYIIRITREFTQGKFKQLPTMSFPDDLELGFFMFLKYIPFSLAYGVTVLFAQHLDWLGSLAIIFIVIFVLPMLAINFIKKGTVASSFEFKVLGPVFENVGDYLVALLKTILIGLVFGLMILILVGYPASMFTQYIFLADFYRRHIK